MYFRLGTSNGIERTLQHLRQEATNHTSRVAALVATRRPDGACALAFAVGGRARRRTPPDTSISAGPSGTYRSGSAQFTLGPEPGGRDLRVLARRRRVRALLRRSRASRSRTARTGSRRAPSRRRDARRHSGGAHLVGRRELPERQLRDPCRAAGRARASPFPGFGWSGGTLQVVDGGLTGGKKAGRFTASGSGSPTISTSPDPVNASPAGRDLHRAAARSAG